MLRNVLPIALCTVICLGCSGHKDSTVSSYFKKRDDVDWLLRLAVKFKEEDYQGVVDESQRYLQKYPDSSMGWSQLGWAHLNLDEYDRAVECFDKALAVDPKWDNAYVGKGVLCRKRRDYAGARRNYLAAIRIERDNAEALSSLSVIELIEGNDEKAIEYGERAWKLRKDDPTIPANLAAAYHLAGNTKKRDVYYEHAKRLHYHGLEKLDLIFRGELKLR